MTIALYQFLNLLIQGFNEMRCPSFKGQQGTFLSKATKRQQILVIYFQEIFFLSKI